jgi:cytochrome c556
MQTNRDLPLKEPPPRWIHGVVLITTIGSALLLSSSFVSAARTQLATPAHSPFKVVASVQQVMTVITIPSSDVVFGAAADTPKTDSAWQTIQNNSLVLAESGNLLMMPGRAKDNLEWVKQSQAMIDAAMIAFNAAATRNADKLADAGDKIYSTCESCHDKYMAKQR